MNQQPTDHDESGADLTLLMNRAVDGLHPPVDRLRHASLSQGRRIRRRRQGAGLLGGVAAATVLAVLVAPGVRGTSADRHGFADDTPDGVTPTAPVSAVPAPAAVPVGFWEMPSTQMRDRLRSLLPAGTHLSDIRLTPDDAAPGQPATEGWLLATVTRDGIAGQSTIELMLWAPGRGGATPLATGASPGADDDAVTTTGPGSSALVSCPGDLVDPTACREVDSGSDHAGRTADEVDGNLTQHLVTVRADGGFVHVAVANTTDDTWGSGSATTGDAPALTTAELLAIADAPTWTDWTPPAS